MAGRFSHGRPVANHALRPARAICYPSRTMSPLDNFPPHSPQPELAFAGNEILSPMGEVILGGLLSSTALNLVVVPALFYEFGRKGISR